MLRAMVAQDRHEFWPNEIDCAAAGFSPNLRIAGHRQATDAYLFSLARTRSGCLATLDRRMLRLLPLSERTSPHLRVIASGQKFPHPVSDHRIAIGGDPQAIGSTRCGSERSGPSHFRTRPGRWGELVVAGGRGRGP